MKPYRDLADLPNAAGFKFIGRLTDGTERPCVVLPDASGCYSAYDVHGVRIFPLLEGWRYLG